MFKCVHVQVLQCMRVHVYEFGYARVFISVGVRLCARPFVEHACVCVCVHLFDTTVSVMLIQ